MREMLATFIVVAAAVYVFINLFTGGTNK